MLSINGRLPPNFGDDVLGLSEDDIMELLKYPILAVYNEKVVISFTDDFKCGVFNLVP